LTKPFDETIMQVGVSPVSVAVKSVKVDETVGLDFATIFDELFVLFVKALEQISADQMLR
jgi:hypothetical protein